MKHVVTIKTNILITTQNILFFYHFTVHSVDYLVTNTHTNIYIYIFIYLYLYIYNLKVGRVAQLV